MSPAPDVLRTSETRTDLLASDAGAAFGASPSGLPEASASTGAAVPAPDEVRAADVGRETGDVGRATGEERIPLAEEQLRVGKRLVNRGTTRVRRFVVETPVEENVSLRSETATIERRPVVGVAPVADADFSEKVVEVTETEEMPVVEKTARVNEEVVVRKDVKDRTETVRDTTRREDVEIDRPGESASERAREASQGATTEAPRPDVRP